MIFDIQNIEIVSVDRVIDRNPTAYLVSISGIDYLKGIVNMTFLLKDKKSYDEFENSRNQGNIIPESQEKKNSKISNLF